MFGFFTLIHLISYPGFVIGLINPRKVLIGDSRTRLKSSGVYACLWLVSLLMMVVTVPSGKPEPVARVETPVTEKAKPSEKSAPTPTVTKVTEDELTTPGWKSAQEWNPSICGTDAHWIKNGASIAVFNACGYLKTNSVERESVVFATAANSEELALEMQAESGYELHFWNDGYNPILKKRDACIVYRTHLISLR